MGKEESFVDPFSEQVLIKEQKMKKKQNKTSSGITELEGEKTNQ